MSNDLLAQDPDTQQERALEGLEASDPEVSQSEAPESTDQERRWYEDIFGPDGEYDWWGAPESHTGY